MAAQSAAAKFWEFLGFLAEKPRFSSRRAKIGFSNLFLHVKAEEKGLIGSQYYVNNPLYPLEDTIANLNIDMIGRVDPKRKDKDPNYIYLIGSDKISQELHDISENINSKYTKLKLDYMYNDDNYIYYLLEIIYTLS